MLYRRRHYDQEGKCGLTESHMFSSSDIEWNNRKIKWKWQKQKADDILCNLLFPFQGDGDGKMKIKNWRVSIKKRIDLTKQMRLFSVFVAGYVCSFLCVQFGGCKTKTPNSFSLLSVSNKILNCFWNLTFSSHRR